MSSRAAVRISLAGMAIVAIAGLTSSSLSGQSDPYLVRARRVLASTPLIDGHNDLPWRIREDKIARGDVAKYDLREHAPGQTDFPRLKAGMIGAQFWSVYTPGEWRDSGYARVQLQ